VAGTVIDKLDLRVASVVPFRSPFAELGRELRATGSISQFSGSQHYRAVADLRDQGVPAILHLGNRHTPEASHKIEIVDTGKMGFSKILGAVEQLFDVAPETLELIRVDAAADIEGIPVRWFKEHCRVQFKRFSAEYEDCKTVSMGSCGVETVNCGKRPNFFRIYNKIAEWKVDHRRILKLLERERMERLATAVAAGIPGEVLHKKVPSPPPLSDIPTFESRYGYPPEGVVLTRVERQIAGGRLPEEVANVKLLRHNALTFDPFLRLQIARGGMQEPSEHCYPIDKYMAGMFFRGRVRSEGLALTRSWLNRVTNGHAARTLETYADFLPPEDQGISREEIFELYRDSTRRQLAA